MTVRHGIATLTAHTDDSTGEIWFGTGRPQASKWAGGGADEFVQTDWVMNADTIRICGTEANADLIVRLYNHRLKTGFPADIRIGGTGSIRPGSDAATVFQEMLENQLPPSVGGWHKISEADYRNYALLSTFREDGRLSDRVLTHLRVHPVYPALSFVKGLQREFALLLIRHIVDPRFLVDPAHPDRFSRMKCRFGLDRKSHNGIYNARAWLHGNVGWQVRAYSEAEIVFNTWYRGDVADRSKIAPRDFLYRAFYAQLQGREETREIALLKASHILLRFLRDVWLDGLTPSRQFVSGAPGEPCRMVASRSYSPTLFVPEHFFRRDDEVQAWYDHTSSGI